MPLSPPTSPVIGQTYEANGRLWSWTGVAWELVISSSQGVQGIIGSQGLQGVQGFAGSQGLVGVQGIQGTQGVDGYNGVQGVQGTQGVDGYNGVQGVQGTQGVDGYNGVQGVQGTVGSQGVQGIQGLEGAMGSQGIAGAGAQGIQGVQGTQGITGTVDQLYSVGNSGTTKTISLTNGNVQTILLNNNCIFTMPSASSAASLTLFITQTGSFTATFSGVKWGGGGVAPNITTGANKIDILSFLSDGTNWYGGIIQNFS